MTPEAKTTLIVGGIGIAVAIALYYMQSRSQTPIVVQGNDQLPESISGSNPLNIGSLPNILLPTQPALPTPDGTTVLAGGSTINAPLYSPVTVINGYTGPTFDMAPYTFNQQPYQIPLPPNMSFPLPSAVNLGETCGCDTGNHQCTSEIAGIYDGSSPLTLSQLVNTVPLDAITSLVESSQNGYNQYQTPNLSIAASPVTPQNNPQLLADITEYNALPNTPATQGLRALLQSDIMQESVGY